MNDLRTWIEIDTHALHSNVEQFLKLIPPTTRFMAVIKSNAYGHGLSLTANLLANSKFETQNSKSRLWFGVDSITEALRLRRDGIQNPILVLGAILPARIQEAREHAITITASSHEAIESLARAKNRPLFHVKIDTGMHRQGFLPHEIPALLSYLSRHKLLPSGVYTHFAAAKDVTYPAYTKSQLRQFQTACQLFKKAGITNMIQHAAASGGTLLYPESHLDMVRIGMGLYGYWPSLESETQFPIRQTRTTKSKPRNIILKPVLTWKTIISEVKKIPRGSFVGYDLTERVRRDTKIAILPVGYWHGYDRGLSSIGEVLIRGTKRKILGRVAMDMLTIDVTDTPNVRYGDEAILIGTQGYTTLWADSVASRIGTSQYEFLTRLNPLIQRNPQ